MKKLAIPLLLATGAISAGSIVPSEDMTLAQQPCVIETELLRLTSTRVTNNWQYRDADYLLNINIPLDSVVSFQKIVFQQTEGADYPSYSTRKSYVFEGGDRSQRISSSSIDNDTNNRTVTVNFDPPLQSGQEITVVLNAFRNPRDGIYIYQVAGLPTGENSRLRRLGTARLSFYQSSGRDRCYR